MIVNREICDSKPNYDFTVFAPRQRVVFFDIETTGLKAGASSLYLIGMLSYEEGSWVLTQYFAESPSEEKEVLATFTEFLRQRLKHEDHLILVTFNGDGFDIPYLKALAEQYHMPDPFYGCISFDLYKAVKPIKKLTKLPDCKLKTVERELCGIDRVDPYNGGELIYVYEEYVRLSRMLKGGCEDIPQNHKLKEKLLQSLLLHNGEDVKDMLSVLQIAAYQSLLDGSFSLKEAKVVSEGQKGEVLDLKFQVSQPLPKELFLEEDGVTVSVSGEDPKLFELVIPLTEKRMRYFYSNHRDYYYLPAEDEAIHKSLGIYTDRANRRQATPQTCYTWKEGTFLPLPGPLPVLEPYFYSCWRGTPHALFDEKLLTDEKTIKELALAALEHFRSAKPLHRS